MTNNDKFTNFLSAQSASLKVKTNVVLNLKKTKKLRKAGIYFQKS